MSKQYYKNLALIFILVNLWCVWIFFDYHFDCSFLSGLTLLTDFFASATFCIGLAVLNLAMRYLLFKRDHTNTFKNSFPYLFCGYSNTFLAVVYLLYVILSTDSFQMISALEPSNFICAANFIFGIFIITDVHKL